MKTYTIRYYPNPDYKIGAYQVAEVEAETKEEAYCIFRKSYRWTAILFTE